jgi:cation diffusion facilitator family transporter
MEDKCVKCGKAIPVVCFFGHSTLAVFKTVVGALAGSKGLVADGLHSASDIIATVMVMITLRISGKKDDESHPWGHGKSEFVGAIIVYAILLGIAIVIFYDAMRAMLSGSKRPPHMVAFFAAVVAVIANFILSGYAYCAGKKLNSPGMVAIANENKADMISGIAVLIGVLAANMGLVILDSVAAIIVGLIIARTAITLGIASFKDIMDASLPTEKERLIEKVILQYKEVKGINFLHTRRVGHSVWIDMDIVIDADKTVKEAHAIVKEVRQALMRRFKHIKDASISYSSGMRLEKNAKTGRKPPALSKV